MSSKQSDKDIWNRLKKQDKPIPVSHQNISKKSPSSSSYAQGTRAPSGSSRATPNKRQPQKNTLLPAQGARALSRSVITLRRAIASKNVNGKVLFVTLSSVLVIGLGTAALLNRNGSSSDENVAGLQDGSDQNSRVADVIVLDEPDFEPLFPTGTTADDFIRKQTKQSPAGDTIFSFEDNINGIPIEVTQQLLPDSLAASPSGGFEQITETLQLTTVTVSPNERRIYYGVSERDGVQSLATLVDERVMVFIRSPQALAENAWQGYVDSLQ